MAFSLRSFFTSAVVKYILSKGLDFVEKFAAEKEEEIEKFVKDLIPGDKFDDVSWQAVKAVLPLIFAAAHKIIDAWQVADEAEKEKLVASAVTEVAALS